MTKIIEEPQGELVVRLAAMPRDVNAHGDIFGGWLLSYMDIAGAGYCQKISRQRYVTVAVESMKFIKPIAVGEFVCCYAQNLGIKNTSMRVGLQAFAINLEDKDSERRLVATGVFVYVSIDKNGRPTPISK